MKENMTLISAVEEIMATKTAAEWEEMSEEYDLAVGRVQMPLEVVEDQQAWQDDFFAEIDHPRFGRFKLMQSPIKVSKTIASIRSVAAELGQHTEEVLLELGYTWDDMAGLKSEGAIL
jgi:crotonobetainyl-CoA:carnitine CoA-transferase CaiB-like acyl-CoA transferase